MNVLNVSDVYQKTIGQAFKKLNVTYKKSPDTFQSERRQTAVLSTTDYWAQGRQIIDLDESGFADDMLRTHGYPKRSKRCYSVLDWRARGRVNVIGALLGTTLLTISMFAGNINSDPFHAWITQALIPTPLLIALL